MIKKEEGWEHITEDGRVLGSSGARRAEWGEGQDWLSHSLVSRLTSATNKE